MKKTIIIIAIAALALAAFGIGTIAYAQAQQPSTTPGSQQPMWDRNGDFTPGAGMMHSGGFGMGRMGANGEYGLLHDYMFPAMAAALGLSPEEFQAKHDAGETFLTVAESQGLSADEAWTLMLQVRTEALNQAVADGVISQEQADWMLEHMDTMMGNGYGFGAGHCFSDGTTQNSFGARGRGGGRRNQGQTTP